MLFIHHNSHITYAGCRSRSAASHSSHALTCHNACSSWQAVLLSCCLNPRMLLSLTPLRKLGVHLQHSVMQNGMLSIQNIWRYLKKHAKILKMSTAVNISESLWGFLSRHLQFHIVHLLVNTVSNVKENTEWIEISNSQTEYPLTTTLPTRFQLNSNTCSLLKTTLTCWCLAF